jgi:hypothetical protein
MPKPFNGVINLDVRDSVADWDAFTADHEPDGSPNVLVLALRRHRLRGMVRRRRAAPGRGDGA